jgi:AhpD family alkylhydroperoxidase
LVERKSRCGFTQFIKRNAKTMSSQESLPKHYAKFKKNEPELFAAWEAIGKAVRLKGPLDLKTGHLIQLAASAALRSEGGVHSHVRRALEAGATPEEVRQCILLISAPPASRR